MNIILLFVGMLSFWIGLGMTEGWKWRMDSGKMDSHPAVNYGNYHMWRGLTNISPIILVFATPSILMVPAFLLGWMLYELTISWVHYDDIAYKRPDFHILGKTFPRPSVDAEIAIVIVLTAISLVYHFATGR